jgi:hypothetical protein
MSLNKAEKGKGLNEKKFAQNKIEIITSSRS